MKIHNLVYSCFGNSPVIGSHIRKQLAFLREIVPAELQHRQMDDLGCGDGKITALLREIFQPVQVRGFDVHPGLVRRAEGRGIRAEVMDLNKRMPGGELAVAWGVLHHLKSFRDGLCRMKDGYPLIFIREPVKTGSVNGLEMGHPLRLKEIMPLVHRHLPGSQIHFCYGSVMIFYACPDYLKHEGNYLFHDSVPAVSRVAAEQEFRLSV